MYYENGDRKCKLPSETLDNETKQNKTLSKGLDKTFF